MSRRKASVFATVLIATTLAAPAGAEIIGEGVTVLRCAESDDATMPKKMEFMQTVMTDEFEGYPGAALIVEAEYAEASDVNSGQVIATVFLIKPDGTRTKLGRLKAKFSDGEAFKLKLVGVAIEEGDRLHWKVKNKKLPTILAALEDCLSFYLFVAVAEEILGSR